MRSPLAILVGIVIFGLLTAGAAAAAYVGVRQIVIDSPIELPPPPQINAQQHTPVPLVPATQMLATSDSPPMATTPSPDATPAIPEWRDPRRFTMLLLGIDQRPQEKGPFRTDTVIVLSVDPVRKTAAMLSIPRDVYVRIPGFKQDRVNTANFIGDLNEYPGGGARLALRTVEGLLGVSIDRYVLINFQAFKTVIDALGTVTVCPTERIFDDKYPDTDTYGVITVEFQPGCQELDSTRLLQYARVRHNAGDDFGRARRQQEVIRAVKDKALSLGGVSALIGQAGAIWEALKDNVKTDLTYDEIIQLANLAQDIPEIQSAVLEIRQGDKGQLLPGKTASGEDILTPIYEEVYKLVVSLFDSGQGVAINTQASEEGAAIYVANGAGVDGLARSIADALIAKGFNVAGIGNAEGLGLYGQSEIRVYGTKFKTARYLAEVLGLENTIIQQAQDGPSGVDIMLIVGKDLAGQ